MSLVRHVSTVGSATLASRVLALLRDMGVAAVLGAGPIADAYFAALQIPNLFRRLAAEGAVNGALVPIWLRLRAGKNDAAARAFAQNILFGTFGALAALAVIGALFAPLVIALIAPGFERGEDRFAYSADFLRLSIAYIAVAGVVAIASAILNAEERVAAAAASITVFNCVLVAAVLILLLLGYGPSRPSGEILAVSFVIAGVAQAALVATALRRLRVPAWPRQRSPAARRFYARAVPALIASGIPQLTLIAGTMIASSSTAAVSWLYYAYRLYELPLGVISAALASVMTPRIAAGVHTADAAGARRTQSQAIELALGLALPAAAGLAVLAHPIARLLFERGAFTATDTHAVAAALTLLVIGLPGHALEKALGAVAFAHEDARTPMQAALAGVATAAAAALALAQPLGHVGVAAGVAAGGWTSSGFLLHALNRRGRLMLAPGTLLRLACITAATAIMTAALLAVDALLPLPVSAATQLARPVASVVAGLVLYAALLQAFGVVRLRALLSRPKARLP